MQRLIACGLVLVRDNIVVVVVESFHFRCGNCLQSSVSTSFKPTYSGEVWARMKFVCVKWRC